MRTPSLNVRCQGLGGARDVPGGLLLPALVAVLEVPGLRDRREDVGLLVEHFRGEVNRRSDLGLDITGISHDAMAILEGDHWPGNVRELEDSYDIVSHCLVWDEPGTMRLVCVEGGPKHSHSTG